MRLNTPLQMHHTDDLLGLWPVVSRCISVNFIDKNQSKDPIYRCTVNVLKFRNYLKHTTGSIFLEYFLLKTNNVKLLAVVKEIIKVIPLVEYI